MASFSPSYGHKVQRRARSERLFEARVRRFEFRGTSNYIRRFSFDLLEGPPKCKSSLFRVGIPKPAYRAFQLLHHLGDEQLTVAGQHDTVEVWAIRKGDQLTLLCVNHALPNHAISTEQVDITISNGPEPRHIHIEHIDEEHANPRQTWLEMGFSEYLNALELEQLRASCELIKEPQSWPQSERKISLHLD